MRRFKVIERPTGLRKSKVECAARQPHRLATDPRVGNRPAFDIDMQVDEGRPAHLDALLDHDRMVPVRQPVEMADCAGESGRRRPGGSCG